MSTLELNKEQILLLINSKKNKTEEEVSKNFKYKYDINISSNNVRKFWKGELVISEAIKKLPQYKKMLVQNKEIKLDNYEIIKHMQGNPRKTILNMLDDSVIKDIISRKLNPLKQTQNYLLSKYNIKLSFDILKNFYNNRVPSLSKRIKEFDEYKKMISIPKARYKTDHIYNAY